MAALASLGAAVLVKASEITNRTFSLPLAVFSPTSRCNSRCVSCDWWQSSGDTDLSLDEVRSLAHQLAELGTRLVVFSGGEPLLRPDVFAMAAAFRMEGMSLHLLTSGVALERHAHDVASHFSRVTTSLDSATADGYQRVRGIAAFDHVLDGLARVRSIAPTLPLTARATLHRHNFREMPALVALGTRVALDGLSFLPADVHSLAFGRHTVPSTADLALTRAEVREFRGVVEETLQVHAGALDSGLLTDSPAKLRRLPAYYSAILGDEPFPPVACNAPWASVVIDANGVVRPCFFHDPIGSVRETSLATLVRSHLPRFRATLDVGSNPTCRRCVCSLNVRLRSQPWA
jgi:MoaA/NifB/PqqE/SkfB family radical SAM enzyme